MNTEVTVNGVEQVEQKITIIGPYKPKEKFLEFVGTKGNIKFHANEAFIEGKYLSGLDLENVKFKLTICDEGTVNLEEVDTELTTSEQRGRLVDLISEKTVTPFNKKMVINELPFTSVRPFKNPVTDTESTIKLYLSVDYQTPISKLASLFDDDETNTTVSSEQYSKVDSLLTSLFGDVYDEEPEVEKEEVVEVVEVVEEKNESQKMLEESFKRMKEEKVNELKNRLDQQQIELKRYLFEKSQAENKIETAKTDIRVLESRLESLQPPVEPNGYFFFVSERLNERITLENNVAELIKSKVSKVKGINVDAFMKLFEQGEYQVRLGVSSLDTLVEVTDYSSLSDEIKNSLSELTIDGDKLLYIGDSSWHEVVDKMIKKGFSLNPEFDKMCGSNSYSVGKFAKDENQDHTCSNTGCVCSEQENNKTKIENMIKFKELERFDKPTDIVILGHYEDVGTRFDITDDESAFDIFQDGKRKATLSCSGFGSVMTLEDYKKLYAEKGDEMGEWGIVEGVVVTEFSGKVGIAAITDEGDFSDDFDLDDYILHQGDYNDVVIDIPSGSIHKLNGDLSLPKSILRDIKIDGVLDKHESKQ